MYHLLAKAVIDALSLVLQAQWRHKWRHVRAYAGLGPAELAAYIGICRGSCWGGGSVAASSSMFP